MSVKNCFIRGSVVRYVQIPRTAVDTTLLEDATRRGKSGRSHCVKGYTLMTLRTEAQDGKK